MKTERFDAAAIAGENIDGSDKPTITHSAGNENDAISSSTVPIAGGADPSSNRDCGRCGCCIVRNRPYTVGDSVFSNGYEIRMWLEGWFV